MKISLNHNRERHGTHAQSSLLSMEKAGICRCGRIMNSCIWKSTVVQHLRVDIHHSLVWFISSELTAG